MQGRFMLLPSYTENITINNEGLTMEPYGTGDKPVIDGGGSGIVVTIISDDVTFEGFDVKNSGTGQNDAGIFLNQVSGVTVMNNDLSGNAIGIGLALGSGNEIFGNIITNSSEYGIVLAGSSSNTIEENEISQTTKDGIAMANASEVGGDPNTGSDSNLIKNNDISNITRDGIFIGENCNSNEITDGNTLDEIVSIGIHVWRNGSQTITGNTITNAAVGLKLRGITDGTITGNTITDNGIGIEVEAYYLGGDWYPASNNEISNNIISDNTFGMKADHIQQTVEVDAQFNWWGSEYGPAHASNPCGLGNSVSDNVSFSPWYFQEEMTTLNGLPELLLSNVNDISTITNTPVIFEIDVTYPAGIDGFDDAVLTDALITSSKAFPTNAKVTRVVYANSLVVEPDYSLDGKTDVYLSDILGQANPLNGHSGTINWEFIITGFDVEETYEISIQSVSYLDRNICVNHLGEAETFSLTFEDADFDYSADPACATGPVEVFYDETYPSISNNGGVRILNDSKWEFFSDELMQTPYELPVNAKITVGEVDAQGVFIWSRTSELTVATSLIYGSAIVTQQGDPSTYANGQLVPLERAATTNKWKAEIENVPAGTYYVKVKNLAMLDVDGTNYNPQFPMGSIPQGPHGLFVEYIYLEDNFEVVYHEAVEVAISVDGVNPLPATPGGGETTICVTFVYNVYEDDINGTLLESNVSTGPIAEGDAIYSVVAGAISAGTYFIETVSITDFNGCQVQPVVMAAGYYNHTLIVNEAVEVEISVDGTTALPATPG